MCAFSDASSKKQMTPTELLDLVDSVRKNKAESNFLELKKAHLGSPKRLYDTLSSFSNQDGGGVFFLDWMKTMTLKQLVSTILKICNGKLKINVDKCNHP